MGSGDYKLLYNDLFSKDPTITNRFNNYKMPFSYSDMSGVLDNLFNQQSGMLTRNAANSVQRGQKDAASRMAAEGITGGSVYNNQINKVTDSTNQSFADALEQLGLGRLGMDAGLMQQENQNQFGITNAASGIDRGNANAWMNRASGLNSILGGMQQAQEYEDQKPTWLDDVMSGLGDIGSLAADFAPYLLAPATGGASLLASPIMGSLKNKTTNSNPQFKNGGLGNFGY